MFLETGGMANPYAIYVNCDGAMDYTRSNPGGIGFVISFPDFVNIPPISISIGTYHNANIEMLELEALISAMKKMIEVYGEHYPLLRRVNRIIFITDRFGLHDTEKTNPYQIRDWRSNSWCNHENKPIKNWRQLDELDKTRKKLTKISGVPVTIEHRPRRKNKTADKLAKAGKIGLTKDKLAKKGEKVGRRKFDGPEIRYAVLKPSMNLSVNIFRKDPVRHQWEVWMEIIEGDHLGKKLKCYCDDEMACTLMRGNQYVITVSQVFRYHILIAKGFEHITRANEEE